MRRATPKEDEMPQSENDPSQWRRIYRLGAMAAIGAVLVGVLEILITFLPGGNVLSKLSGMVSVLSGKLVLGASQPGLLNIFLDVLAVLIFFALYAAHRQNRYHPYAALVVIIFFLGVGVFLATNRAFPMLALSKQYALAASDAQRAMLEAAGQSMLSVGQSHTPGTFLGFFLMEFAGMAISLVMLRSGIFSKATAYMGILGFGLLSVFEFFSSFVSGLSSLTMALAMFGGLLSMAWYILTARRLFQLG
jgi:hypothetical protein